MQLLYNPVDGEIFYAIYNNDIFRFTHTTNIPLSEFIIDEVEPDNKLICLDVQKTVLQKDVNGLGKYYIDEGELHSRDGWQEYVPEMPI
jgi:hypothetical protein